MTKFGDFKKYDAEYYSKESIKEIDALASAGDIDPLSNLVDNAVMIISGTNDPVVPAEN